MSLRSKINLIVGVLTVLFVAGLAAVEWSTMREAVKEEVLAAHRAASQVLRRVAALHGTPGAPSLRDFLEGLGRVRSNDVVLLDADGRALYRSPPSTWKPGRDAPTWFVRQIAPEQSVQTFVLADGRLEVRTDASRAALDAWDTLRWFTGVAAALLLLVNGLVFWLVGRAARPFARIVRALDALQAGRLDRRLPPLPGREAGAIGVAFNRMVGMLNEHIETERRAARAEHALDEQRELARWIGHRIEEERRMIARELHDELGQSVTAIRSLALSVAQRVQPLDAGAADAARVIGQEASRLYDAMHGLIPRLTPLVLDRFGLPEALDDLAERTRRAHPALALHLAVDLGEAAPDADTALALYRAVQEGITNALRHGGAGRVQVRLEPCAGGLRLQVQDDGRGPAGGGFDRPGHHGLRWLGERVQALGGRLDVATAAGDVGVCLHVEVPCARHSADLPAPAAVQPG